jgi:site-specific DNA-methyltransferase (adenine-specific)
MRGFTTFIPKESLKHLKTTSNFVIRGDSTNSSSYKTLLRTSKQRKATILLTDPPYCLLERKRTFGEVRDYKAKRASIVDEVKEVPKFQSLSHYRTFTNSWLSLALEYGLKEHSDLIIWTNYLGRAVIIDICREKQYHLLGEYSWAKPTSTKSSTTGISSISQSSQSPSINRHGAEVLLRVNESALIFRHNNHHTLTNINIPNQPPTNGHQDYIYLHNEWRLRSTIPWTVIGDIASHSITQHPCHKPLSVIQPLVDVWSTVDDIILDPFAGSGGVLATTLLAESRLSKSAGYFGIEILDNWVTHCQHMIQSQSTS